MYKLVSSAALALAAAAPALAQDAGSNSWTGPYAGIQAGYDFDSGYKFRDYGTTSNNLTALNAGIRPNTINQNRSGFIGGGQLGYNLQRGHLIVGAEGNFDYSDSRGRGEYFGVNVPGTTNADRRTVVNSRLDWMGSARGRLGYAPNDMGMFYVSGGYAFGRVKGNAEFDGDTTSQINYAGSHKYTAQGWIAGAGVEFRPFSQGMLSKVSIGAEGSYYNLGSSSIYALQTSTQPGYYRLGIETRGVNGVAKINYHF